MRTRRTGDTRPCKVFRFRILLAAAIAVLFVGCGKKSGPEATGKKPGLEVTDWAVASSISNATATAEAQMNHQKFVVVHSRIVGKVPWAKSADEQWNITKHMFTLTAADGQDIQALYLWGPDNMSGLGALMSFMQGDHDVELPEVAFMVSEDVVSKGALKFRHVALPPVVLDEKLRKR